jgi:hypothetical protein
MAIQKEILADYALAYKESHAIIAIIYFVSVIRMRVVPCEPGCQGVRWKLVEVQRCAATVIAAV